MNVPTKKMLSVIIVSSIYLSLGCGGGSTQTTLPETPPDMQLIGNALSSTNQKVNLKNYNSSVLSLSGSMGDMMTGIQALISNASSDFNKPITLANLTNEELQGINNALVDLTPSMAEILLHTSDIVTLGKSFEAVTTNRGISIPKNANDDNELTTQERPLAFVVAGLAVLGYGTYTAVANAIESRTEPAKKAVTQTPSGSEEHKQINISLGLSPDAPKTQTVETFNNLGLGQKLIKSRSIEIINATDGNGSVSNEVSSSIAKTAKSLGETAVNTTVGALTTATGGQFLDKIAQATGLPQTSAALVDLGISAAGKQPLDLLSSHLTATTQSTEKETVTIAAPSSNLSLGEAKEILQQVSNGNLDNITDPQKLKDAINVIAQNSILESVENPESLKNADGSITVNIPKKNHIVTVEDPKNNETVTIADTGLSDTLINLIGKVPELISNIDMASNPNIGIEYVDVEDFTEDVIQEPTLGNFNLLVVVTPSNPDPGQSVSVTATINPITESKKIIFSVSGTDGYTKSGQPLTDATGKISFSIPGGGEGIVDTIEVTVEGGITKTFSYTF